MYSKFNAKREKTREWGEPQPEAEVVIMMEILSVGSGARG